MQERVFKLRLPMQHCPYVAAPLRQGWTIPFYKVKATMFRLLQNSSITKPGFVILNECEESHYSRIQRSLVASLCRDDKFAYLSF